MPETEGSLDAAFDSGETGAPLDPSRIYGARYYAHDLGVPYEFTDHWRAFFGGIADHVINELAPKTALDAGCAKGFFVHALRERGVDASGFDVSPTAIEAAPGEIRAHVRVGSLLDPIAERVDLITCIEVIEHLDPADVRTAVANLCAATDRILLSSSPDDFEEPTHTCVLPPERWTRLFAEQGFFRDFRHDASYMTPWAVLYVRGEPSLLDVVLDYDRELWQLRREVIGQRQRLLEQHLALEDAGGRGAATVADVEELLRLRDLVIGKDAELGVARGQLVELQLETRGYRSLVDRHEDLELRHEAVLSSTSWRVAQRLMTPLRRLRGS